MSVGISVRSAAFDVLVLPAPEFVRKFFMYADNAMKFTPDPDEVLEKTKAELRAEIAALRDALDAITDGFILLDADDRVVAFNAAQSESVLLDRRYPRRGGELSGFSAFPSGTGAN